ncbi:hypothetical protein [Streptomyces flaveolus]|uniref:hypothetical protein n=1 Tax=Streptomyces flaveolus TaxID=67297 RepID=UPI0037FA8CC8
MGLDHASLTSLAALGEATRRRMFELFRHERRLTHSIEEFGHEPERTVPTLMRLRNGPFHPMAAKAPELICAVKQAFLAGHLHAWEAKRPQRYSPRGSAHAVSNARGRHDGRQTGEGRRLRAVSRAGACRWRSPVPRRIR